MKKILVEAGPFRFVGQLEEQKAPRTCQRFLELLPFRNKVIHSRWSGEAVWIPLGDFDTGLTTWLEELQLHRVGTVTAMTRGDIAAAPEAPRLFALATQAMG